MSKLKKYWLNEHGERYWYLKSDPTITAHRSYYWVDRISYIHERTVYKTTSGRLTTSDRRFLGSKEFDHPTTYTQFKKEVHLWCPIDNYDNYIQTVLQPLYRKRKLIKINDSQN